MKGMLDLIGTNDLMRAAGYPVDEIEKLKRAGAAAKHTPRSRLSARRISIIRSGGHPLVLPCLHLVRLYRGGFRFEGEPHSR